MVTARVVRPSAATGANEEEATSERGQHGWHVHPSMSHDLYQIRHGGVDGGSSAGKFLSSGTSGEGTGTTRSFMVSFSFPYT